MKKLLLLTLLMALSAHSADKVITDPEKLRETTDKYRSDPNRPKDFIPQGDGTVIDKRTGLQWMRCSIGQRWTGKTCAGKAKKYEWYDAMDLQEAFAGHSDWRLPSYFELATLVYCSSSYDEDSINDCKGKYQRPTIVKKAFPNTEAELYWAFSQDEYSMYNARVVDFSYGRDGINDKKYDGYVRLVRGEQ